MNNYPHSGSKLYTVENPSQQYTAGKWVEHLSEWEKHGSPGVPPGLEDIQPAGEGPRDYTARKPGYYLRPEVRLFFFVYWFLGPLNMSYVGRGELLSYVENDWGGEVEGKRMGCFPSYPEGN